MLCAVGSGGVPPPRSAAAPGRKQGGDAVGGWIAKGIQYRKGTAPRLQKKKIDFAVQQQQCSEVRPTTTTTRKREELTGDGKDTTAAAMPEAASMGDENPVAKA